MFTTIDKAIAALIAPILSLLFLVGLIPESFNTPEVIAGITSFVTAIAVWAIPNKEE